MTASKTSCPICGGATLNERSVFDDRYGYPGTFALLRCPTCGHRTLDADLTDSDLIELYTHYYPRGDFDPAEWTAPPAMGRFRTWLSGAKSSAFRWIPGGSRVLDIGCGFCESLGYHRDRGSDAAGVEADANALRIAAAQGFDVRPGLFDPAVFGQDRFDFVTLDQVIEHSADPVKLLREAASLLKPGGTLVLSTPDADGLGARLFGGRWIHWHTPYHLQFFSPESMRRAAAAAGLDVIQSQSVTPNAWIHYQWDHLVAPTVPGRPSAFWSRKTPRKGWQKLLFAGIGVADRLGVNALLARAADALDRGDNRVYLLRSR